MTGHNVLIHYHIFKNAGSSVDRSLQRCFADQWGTFEGAHAHAIQSAAKLREFLATHPDLLAVSSHLARPPLPHDQCLPVVFLRHPLLRAYSVYSFSRLDTSQPYSEVAQEFTFADYIRWALSEGRGSIVIRDYQVVHLSSASWRTDHILDARAGRSDLEEACQLLADWGIAGVVEQFELSAKVFQAEYAPRLPGLEFTPRWENATLREPPSTQERLDELRSMLGEVLYAGFMEANQLDLALYQHAQSLLASAARRLKLTISNAEVASQPLTIQAPKSGPRLAGARPARTCRTSQQGEGAACHRLL